MTITPAHIIRDASGAPFAPDFGDIYASRQGAAAQARHVFLGGNGLPGRWAGRRQFVVLENGFGLGTNFLATLAAWRADPQRCSTLHYVATELHPASAAALIEFADPELKSLAAELARQWPPALPGLHRLVFDAGAVKLTLALGDARHLVPRLGLGFDALYLDGFAPARNPQMWEAGLLKALTRLARPGATAATWSCAAALREALVAGGFAVESRPGFGRKPEMSAAVYAPRWRARRFEPPSTYAGERRVVVIGAGLAGAHVAAEFGARGLQHRRVRGGVGGVHRPRADLRRAAHLEVGGDGVELLRVAGDEEERGAAAGPLAGGGFGDGRGGADDEDFLHQFCSMTRRQKPDENFGSTQGVNSARRG